MKVHGIEFTHRRAHRPDEQTSKDYAEFTHFATLLESANSADSVKSVFYDTSSQAFCIELKPDADGLDHQMVRDAASMSLTQYILDGYAYQGRGQEMGQ